MEKKNSQDQRLLGDLRTLLETVEPGSDVIPSFVGALREALHAERGLMYGVDVGPERYQTSFAHNAGFPLSTPPAQPVLDQVLGSLKDPWGYFNPACPQPAQRNRVIQFRPAGTAETPPTPAPRDERLEPWRKLGMSAEEQEQLHSRVRSNLGTFMRRYGVDQMVHLRVLVCEDASLLGWVGVMRMEPFGARELNLLHELTPVLQRRLRLDTRLREAGVLHAALEGALEAIGQPAYVVTATGRVAHTNTSGRTRLEREGARPVAEALQRHQRGEPLGESLSITPLRLAGLPTHYLAIHRDDSARTVARVHELGTSWKLTARETEVLDHLIRGESNKTIAGKLGCAERTVEVHVTRILAKARVESRSALISRVFLHA
ncbi:MAG TPA: LuxR family transcriptional regulator [Archangium sp.]|uniref:LuxR family transcriptional regulator n=1 Tax=Archangium sp. TaxID=1872627 RepID=UPI002ED8073A